MRTDAAREDQRHSTVTVMTTVNSTETVVTITGESKLHGLLYNILCYKIFKDIIGLSTMAEKFFKKKRKLPCIFWHKLDRKTLYAYRCF